MLTGDLARPRLQVSGGEIKPRLLPVDDAGWLITAEALLAAYRAGVGASAGALDAAVNDLCGDRPDFVVLRGLAKVLDDQAAWAEPAAPLPPEEIRRRLFAGGPAFAAADPAHTQTRDRRLAALAAELGVDAAALEAGLYADRPVERRLVSLEEEWTPERLLARYNLELARAVLYWADEVTVEIHDSFKSFWRYVKLFRLMHWATPLVGGGYRVVLDGPISPFVRATTRYGRQFAAFLPALFLGRRWQMTASVRWPRRDHPLRYRLDDAAPLVGHFRQADEFDSKMEADFAAEFAAKLGHRRGAWTLTREDEVLLVDDTVMIPDFTFENRNDGRRVLVEIIGFWHPDYLRRKLAKLRAAQRTDLLLLVYEGSRLAPAALTELPNEVLFFKRKPIIKDVIAAVERIAAGLPQPPEESSNDHAP